MEFMNMSTQLCLLAWKGIMDNLEIVKRTVAKPDGDKWRHRVTGIEHARLVNSTENAQAAGMIYAYAEILKQACIDIEVKAWIESNNMTGLDEYHVRVEDTPISYPIVRDIIIDRCERNG